MPTPPSLTPHGKNEPLTFIDLFAGIGGFRMGFEQAGFGCVFSSEWDSFARQTYAANFDVSQEIFAGDIRDISPESVPDHDVLTGGFPCQPFSLAGVSKKNSLGRAHGFADETQGTLFFNIAAILDAKRPRAFVLENVRNLLSHDQGRTLSTILKVLQDDLGYFVDFKIVDASPFVPQRRRRVFIVGFSQPDRRFDWDKLGTFAPEVAPKMLDILHGPRDFASGSSPYVDSRAERVLEKYTLSDKLWRYLQGYAEKHRKQGNGFGFGLVDPGATARTLSARYGKDGSEILVPSRDSNPRRLTPRECARLMGFPDSFIIPVSDSQAYKQFGNAVAVPVVSSIATLLREALS